MPGKNERITAPSIIVLNVPSLRQGPLAARCEACEACDGKFPVHASTVLTMHQMKKAGKPHVVICHGCYSVLRAANPDLDANGKAIGVQEARRVLGLNTDL